MGERAMNGVGNAIDMTGSGFALSIARRPARRSETGYDSDAP